MAVSGANVTVQVPEGCTIPTSGGVSAVAYSTMANPYGFVGDKGRWEVITFSTAVREQTGASTTWYEFYRLTIPVGTWIRGYAVNATHNAGAAALRAVYVALGETTAAVPEDTRLLSLHASNSEEIFTYHYADAPYRISTAKVNYLNARVGGTAAPANGLDLPSIGTTVTVFAKPSNL